MQLKVDLHTHSGEDPVDKFVIKHSARDLVELAIQKRYGALAITNHTEVHYNQELDSFAANSGLILIPGMEAELAGKHVLLYCPKDQSAIEELNRISRESRGNWSFDDVRRLKERGLVTMVMAPHPYHILPLCLGDKFVANYDLFDLAEISWYHTRFEGPFDLLNRNQKTRLAVARLAVLNGHEIMLIASSDAHHLKSFGRAYSLVDAEHDLESIVGVLRSGDQSKIELVYQPVSLFRYSTYPAITLFELIAANLRTSRHR